MKRQAIFAEQGWYPQKSELARRQVEMCLDWEKQESETVAAMVPHAGWAYSGTTAGKLYAEIIIPDRVVVLCPMHRAGGENVALWDEGVWETPVGDVEVDEEFARALLKNSDLCKSDPESHRLEHAIEIQLPFLKVKNENVKIVPIRLGRLSYEQCKTLAGDIARQIETLGGKTLVLASSDMSHESEVELVKHNDEMAKEKIMQMDGDGLIDTVVRHSITMCGYIPACVAIEASKLIGASKAREVAQTNSGEISGRYDYVVGYLSVRFDK